MSDPSTSSTPATTPQSDPATTPTGQAPTSTAPTPIAAPAPAQGEDTAATIARLESDLAAARAEAGKSRVTAKQRAADEARIQLAQDIGRALGITPDGQEADPAQLTAQLTASQAQARQTAVELSVYRHAAEAGATPTPCLTPGRSPHPSTTSTRPTPPPYRPPSRPPSPQTRSSPPRRPGPPAAGRSSQARPPLNSTPRRCTTPSPPVSEIRRQPRCLSCWLPLPVRLLRARHRRPFGPTAPESCQRAQGGVAPTP